MARGLVAVALCLTLVSAYMPVPAAAAPQDEVAVTLPKPPRQPRPPLDPQTPSDGQNDPVQPPTVRIPGGPVLMAGTPATYTVTTTADSTDNNTTDGVCADALGRCSLRAAVQQANAHAGDDTILLPAGTYTLSLSGGDEQTAASGDLDILENLTIIGAGGNADGNASATVIDGGAIDRVFSVNPFPWDKIVNATFKALTIQNGKPVGTGDMGTGGGIDFTADNGTSTPTQGGQLYVYNCIIRNNQTVGTGTAGAGIFLINTSSFAGTASAIIEKSTITGNIANNWDAGGIMNSGMPLTILDSTISDNHARSSMTSSARTGGGLYVNNNGSATIRRSTFSGNTAEGDSGYGGAIGALSATLTVENATISGNEAGKQGGAIYATSTTTLTNVTMTQNYAGTNASATGPTGGGIYTNNANVATLRNTIVYDNFVGNPSDATPDTANEVGGQSLNAANSYNNLLSSNGTGGLTNGTNGNKVGVNPLLSPLADNGGLTKTHALQDGSPALDAGNNAYAPTTDQRGRTRTVDALGESPEDTTAEVDIGAFEVNPMVGAVSAQAGTVGQALAVPLSVAGTGTTVTAASSNTSVVPNDAGHLSVTNPTSLTPTLQITGIAEGTSTITVTVAAAEGGTDTVTFNVTLTGRVDLTVTKTHSGNFRQGGTGTYTITVRNQGSLPTSGTVTVTDTLPAGLTATSLTSTDATWSCTLGTLTCTRSDVLAAGGSWAPITLGVSATGAPGSVTNQVTVSGGGDPDTAAANTATDPTTIDPSSDLAVLVTGPASVVKGGSGTNTIFVTNNGPSATSGTITVTDTLPAGLTLTSASGTGWTCNSVSPIVCTRTTALANGSTANITVDFTVDGTAGASVTNTVSVTHANDLNAANNTAGRTMTVESYPDLTVTKSHSGNFRQGGTGTYVITVSNSGYADTNGTVTLTDTLPAGLTATAMGGTGWTCDIGTVSCTSNAVVAAGSSFGPVTLTVAVDANAGSPLTNQVSVSGGGEQNTGNNTASDPTTVDKVADLTITKTDGGATFTQGQTGTYTLTVTNSGEGPTVGTVTVTDGDGSGYTVTGMSGTGWDCTAGTSCTRSDALAAGASYPAITVTVSVGANTGRSITNTATVSGGGELNATNNSATDTTSVKQLPDLWVDIGPVGGGFTQGQTGAQYTISVANSGTGLTTGTVTVTVDTLNGALTPTGLSGTGWTCTLGTLTCTRSDDLAGGAGYEPIILTVDVAADAPTSATSVVSVSGGDDQNVTNNTSSHTTTIIQKPDLTVDLSHSGNFREGQTGVTYTIVVHNAGGQPTSGTVTLVDTLPAGLTATAMTGTGWTCNLGSLTCTNDGTAAAGGDFPAITLTVDVANDTSATLTNSVSVSGGGELNTGNNTDSDPTTIDQVADLTLTMTDGGATFTQGQTGTYTLTVTNIGEGPTVGTVSVLDLSGDGFTVTGMSGTGWTCDAMCYRNDALASGASYPPVTVTVAVGATTGRTITNTASAAGGGELNFDNAYASVTTNVKQLPDLQVNVAPAGAFTQGQTGAQYTLTVTNTGTGLTTGTVSVAVDPLDGSLTPTDLSGTGWSCTLGTLTCTRSDELAGGASYAPITLTVDVAAGAPTSVTTRVTVAGGDDQNVTNNTGSHTTSIVQKPDLTVSVSHTGNFREGQTGATYTIVVHNAGGLSTDAPVTLVDTLPAGLTATAMTGTGWTCNEAAGTCTYTDPVAAGADFPAVTLTVTVADDTPASLTNSVSVSGGGELNTGNNTDSDPTTIDQVADLTVTKTDGGATFTQGQTGTYTLTVSNSGEGPTVGSVTVTDPDGSGFTVSGMSGTGWDCTAGTSCTRSDALAAGASYPAITVTVSVGANTGRTITNTATVAGGGELNTTNNAATDTTTVKQLPDLQVNIAPAGAFTQGQTGAQYTITVTNTGTGLTTGTVSVTVDAVPAALTPTGLSGTGWSCDAGTLTCTRSDDLAGSASYDPITLTVDVAADAPTLVTTGVSVAGGDDQDTTNNEDRHTTTIVQVPDLTVAMSHTGDFRQGTAGSYTITVRNDGGLPTSAPVTLTETLPAGLTATAMTGTNWSCSTATGICTWTGAPVAAHTDFPAITVTVAVDPDAEATVTNTVSVSGGGELITANNTATDPTNVVQIADLQIIKAHTGNFRQGQNGAQYTIIVRNVGHGPTDAPVTVTDTLPDGLTLVSIGTDGDGWTCDTATDPRNPTCSRSDVLANGPAYWNLTVTVNVAGNAPNSLTNVATVSGGGEVKLNNNESADLTTIVQTANLTIDKFHHGNFNPNQRNAKYYIRVKNTGVGPTDAAVTVSDLLPDGLTATAMAGDGWTCDLATLTCTRADALAPGGTYPLITITVTVERTAPKQLTNVATVSGGGEWNLSDNSDSDPTKIAPPETPSSNPLTVIPPDGDVGQESVTLTGTASPGATVIVGGVAVTADANGNWSATVPLQNGTNQITVTSEGFSRTVTVVRDSTPPPLTLTASALTTDKETVELLAVSEPGATIEIGGIYGGTRTAKLALGLNTFTATATDAAGNKTTATITVERVARVLFVDVTGHWAEATINRMADLDIAWGYADKTFRPDAPVTRLDFAVMIARLLKLAPTAEPLTFTDLGEIPAWTRGPLAAALKAGIIKGRGAGLFDPYAPITRAEVAVMMTRALAYAGKDVTPGDAGFTDGDQIPDWARDHVKAAARFKLITGYEDGSFRPGNTTTRAEAVTLLARLLDATAK